MVGIRDTEVQCYSKINSRFYLLGINKQVVKII